MDDLRRLYLRLGIGEERCGTDGHPSAEELEARVEAVGPTTLSDPLAVSTLVMGGAPLQESTYVAVLNCMNNEDLSATAKRLLPTICRLKEETPVEVTERLLDCIREKDSEEMCQFVMRAAASHSPRLVAMLARKLPHSVWSYDERRKTALHQCLSNAEKRTKTADMEVFSSIVALCPHSHLVGVATPEAALCGLKSPLVVAAERRLEAAVEGLLRRLSPMEIFGSGHGNPCWTAVRIGDVPLLARLLALHEECAGEEGVMERQELHNRVWNGAAGHGNVGVLEYLLAKKYECEGATVPAVVMSMLQHSIKEAQWLFKALLGALGFFGATHNVLSCFRGRECEEVIAFVVEECLRLPREELAAMLLWNSDRSVTGLAYPPQCRNHSGEEGKSLFLTATVWSPPLFRAVEGALFAHMLPLVEAAPESLYSTMHGSTVLHAVASAPMEDLAVMSRLVQLAPREVVIARDSMGKTALDYLQGKQLVLDQYRGKRPELDPDLALAMATATKGAMT